MALYILRRNLREVLIISFAVHILKKENKFKMILKFITVLDLCIKHFVNCCIPIYLMSEIVSDQRNRCFYF